MPSEDEPAADVTGLLRAWAGGDAAALDRLAPAVYPEMRRIARRYMAGERPGRTLQPTALANEAFLRLVHAQDLVCNDRAHFFAVCAQIMRRLLVDTARARRREKRGAGAVRATLDDAIPASPAGDPALVALDDALEALAQVDPRKAKVVELRYFGGMEVEEVAHVLGVSPQTVMRDWKMAKAWLGREIARK